MAIKRDLEIWIKEALMELGGQGHLIEVAKIIWIHHEHDLRKSGDLFYTWQYDMRWAANKLRASKDILPVKDSPSGVWILRP
nr:hypothetical protein [uncultured Desulfuromonas sp.]